MEFDWSEIRHDIRNRPKGKQKNDKGLTPIQAGFLETLVEERSKGYADWMAPGDLFWGEYGRMPSRTVEALVTKGLVEKDHYGLIRATEKAMKLYGLEIKEQQGTYVRWAGQMG